MSVEYSSMEELKKQPRWTFPAQKLRQISPSGKDGISFEDELIEQSKAARFIVQVCDQLKLPPIAIFTASIFLHRFYVRFSLKRIHRYEAAGACVFLASKTEETPRRLKEVAIACARVASKNPRQSFNENSSEVVRWIDSIIYTEESLLEALFFDFNVQSPYAALGQLTRKIGVSRVDQFSTLVTAFINDSCRTMLGVIFSPSVIAAGGIYWASKYLRVPIADIDGDKWYKSEGLDRRTLVDVVNTMADMIEIVRNGLVDGQEYHRIPAKE